MVHAGAGATDDERNRGTLVNALLHHMARLSALGGELRPGIVHRLDRATSGLIVVAKNDAAHRKLAAQFSRRQVKKTYIALVQGWVNLDRGTIDSSISRDRVRRTRMTTRRTGGREAITHYKVARRIPSKFGKFTLLELQIDTGRTHQIRVHLAWLKHPVVGDETYGAGRDNTIQDVRLRARVRNLGRHFLHAEKLAFTHPQTQQRVEFSSELPRDLAELLMKIEQERTR